MIGARAERLRASARRWHASLAQPRDLAPIELNGVIASLAYHLRAIRQIDRSIQGPNAEPRA